MGKMAQRYEEQPLSIHALDAYGATRELARCSDDALTFCLRTLHEEGQVTCMDDIGIMDRESCAWLVSPYPASVFGKRETTENECDHKWREYPYGWACRDCGATREEVSR